MIKSKKDYLRYIESDRIALNEKKNILRILFSDRWLFQRRLRRLEYAVNCNKSKWLIVLNQFLFLRISQKMGFSIPINTFGPGLSIAHRGTIAVNGGAKIGKNCRLHVCVNIGTEAGKDNVAPIIGDNCYIAPGAKIFGNIIIGDNVVIGANSVVNKSFPEGNCTLGGIPAKVISTKNSSELIHWK